MGPANQSDKRTNPLYYRVRLKATLFRAWAKVRENGLASSSEQTRNEVKDFAATAETAIPAIAEKLRKRRYAFGSSRGILISKKSKKSSRPVVIAPVSARVVQRAILDVVQEIPEIHAVLHSGYNFGGVEGKGFGVPAAVEKALIYAQSYGYFIRTDIKSFFTAVPRQVALSRIGRVIDDSLLVDLLKAATDTELANSARFGADVGLFPLGDMGVAQGSSLSPLLCNFLLHDFDVAMNRRNVACVRYIDDFILLAKDKATAFKALSGALKHLSALNLDAYDPLSTVPGESEKAEHGFTKDGFDFLGCNVRPDRVRPTKENCSDLLGSVKNCFNEALTGLIDPRKAIMNRKSYADAISGASNIVRGWGNTYSFCSDDQLMLNLDIELSKLFNEFNQKVKKRLSKCNSQSRRRYFGFFCLEDCKREPNDIGIRKLVLDYKRGPANDGSARNHAELRG